MIEYSPKTIMDKLADAHADKLIQEALQLNLINDDNITPKLKKYLE